MELTHYHFQVLPSTQKFARHHMRCLRPVYSSNHWFLFSTDAQTEGEGTQKRAWYAPQGNLCATFAFFLPKVQKTALTYLPQVSVIAAAEAIEALSIKPTIKWINDLLINQKKVAGILCESFSSNFFPNHYVILIGIGINIHLSRIECDKIDQPATSLWLETGESVSRDRLLGQIGVGLHAHVRHLINDGFAFFQPRLNHFGFIQ